ncbi:MAG: alpha/beta hydrolase [Myxococcota bacterium]
MVETTRVQGRAVSSRRQEGRGPTLVFLHGAADCRHAWDRLIDSLDGSSCVAFDRPGRLGSEGPPLRSVGEMASFCASFVETEVEGDYVWVGHSLGGALAIELALEHASRHLKGVVLMATGARLRVHPAILALFEGLAAADEPAGPSPGLLADNADSALADELGRNLALTPSSTGLADWKAADGFDRMADVERLSVPTLVIGGTADALTPPKYAEYLHTKIPSSDLTMFEGSGHMVGMERAPEVADSVRRFVASL